MSQTTTTEAANKLGVPKSTLHTWLNQLPIPHETDSRGRKLFDAEALAVLEAVKSLRDEDHGYQTIRRKIGGVREPVRDGTGHEPDAGQGERDAHETAPHGLHSDHLADALVPRLVEALTAQNDLGERYAKATYQIGKLEADVGHQRERAERAERELAEARQQLAQLTAPTPARPWWKFWS